MGRIKAVVFDMDGLMFGTEIISANCWQQAGEESGLSVGEEFLAETRGSSKAEAEKHFYKCYGEGYSYWSIRNRKTILLREYLNTHEIPVKKGLMELLSYLRERNYRIVLATSTAAHYALSYLESAGVIHYFDDFVCGDMVEHSKPDPEIFIKAAEKVGCIPSECVVLEDSLNGNRAAVAGGFIPIMVPDISQPDSELEEVLAAKCESLLEVMEVLKKWETEYQE